MKLHLRPLRVQRGKVLDAVHGILDISQDRPRIREGGHFDIDAAEILGCRGHHPLDTR